MNSAWQVIGAGCEVKNLGGNLKFLVRLGEFLCVGLQEARCACGNGCGLLAAIGEQDAASSILKQHRQGEFGNEVLAVYVIRMWGILRLWEDVCEVVLPW